MLEPYCTLKTKLKTSADLKEALGYLGQPATGTDRQLAVKDFSNKATGSWCCSLELVTNTSNIRSDNGILAFDHYLTLLFQTQRCY